MELEFKNLPVDRETASLSTWGPYLGGKSYYERNGFVVDTEVPVNIEFHNGVRQPVKVCCAAGSRAATALLKAGYRPA
jgi:hypothetical protein